MNPWKTITSCQCCPVWVGGVWETSTLTVLVHFISCSTFYQIKFVDKNVGKQHPPMFTQQKSPPS